MHILYRAAAAAGLLGLAASAFAQPAGCDAKRQEIEQQIAHARANGNSNRLAGLETALAGVKANCTDASLRRDAKEKVEKAQAKLDERERELQEARDEGRSADKIAARQRKVDEARAELSRAQAEAGQ